MSASRCASDSCKACFVDGGSEFARLQQLLKDGDHGLNDMESRWEVRFQHVEGELEELASRNARVLRTVLDMRRDQSSTIARTSQLETNVGDVCNRVAELSRSVGTLLAEMKDHLRQEKELLNDKWGSLRRGLDELCRKVSRVDFDLELMKSQRSVDRARTEQVQHGIAVLEASSIATTNTVQRLEGDIARLEHLSERQALAIEDLALAQTDCHSAQDSIAGPVCRTLADELHLGDFSMSPPEDPPATSTDFAAIAVDQEDVAQLECCDERQSIRDRTTLVQQLQVRADEASDSAVAVSGAPTATSNVDLRPDVRAPHLALHREAQQSTFPLCTRLIIGKSTKLAAAATMLCSSFALAVVVLIYYE